MATFTGIDISQWQGQPDWNTLVQHVSFVFYKGTGSDNGNYVDADFLFNHAEARRTGIPHGVYHFAGGSDNPVAEAEYFYQQCCTNLIPGEIVILDAERGTTVDPAWALPFLNRLEQLVGFKPLIYMNLNTEHSHDWSEVVKQNYGLWLADWDGNPDAPVFIAHWPFCAFQQYADNIHVPGVENGTGNVDGDAFFAPDMSYFAKYGKPVPVPPPVVVPTPPPPVVTPTPPPQPTTPVVPTPPIPGDVVTPEPPAVDIPVTVKPGNGTSIDGILPPKSTTQKVDEAVHKVNQIESVATANLPEIVQTAADLSEVKTGYKTTEFWVTVATDLATLAGGLLPANSVWVKAVSAVTAAVITTAYIISRVQVKKHQATLAATVISGK